MEMNKRVQVVNKSNELYGEFGNVEQIVNKLIFVRMEMDNFVFPIEKKDLIQAV
jgi:hypothetical protein